MSAPSALHESRVADLELLADLAGFTVPVQLYARRVPDLVRLHRSQPSLVVADAKATELASCRATQERLLDYLTRSRLWSTAGYTVHLLVCHDEPAVGWQAMLERLATAAGFVPVALGWAELVVDNRVTGIRLDRNEDGNKCQDFRRAHRSDAC